MINYYYYIFKGNISNRILRIAENDEFFYQYTKRESCMKWIPYLCSDGYEKRLINITKDEANKFIMLMELNK